MQTYIKSFCLILAALVMITSASHSAEPVLGVLIPSQSLISNPENNKITIEAWLGHPFTKSSVSMKRPRIFACISGSTPIDLRNMIQQKPIHGEAGWVNTYTIKDPGQSIFIVEEDPVMNPQTGHMTAQMIKTYINAYGSTDPWTPELAIKTEIIPLTTPYGQPSGSLFQGMVKKDEILVRNTPVTAVYYNKDSNVLPIVKNHISFDLNTDESGIFSFVPPRAGWWGFSCTTPAGYSTKANGKEVPVDFAAVLWVEFHNWE